MTFEIPLHLIVALLPPLCVGTLLTGTMLFFYMYLVYKKPLYGSILIAGILALGFVGSETLLMFVGNIRLDLNKGRIFHITEQLSGALYLTALPFLLQQFLVVTPKWKSFNRILLFVSFIISISICTAAIIQPDLFISMTDHKANWLTHQANYARGQEGILYQVRDLLLGIYMIYSFIFIIYDIIKREDNEYVIYLAIGLFLAFFGAVNDTVYVYFGRNIDFIDINYSRFSLGITLMILVMMAGTMKEFIFSAKQLEILHHKLVFSENRYRGLFNGTDDIILTADINFYLISANNAALKHLSLSKDNLSETNFADLFEDSTNKDNVAFQIIKEKLDNFSDKRSFLSFKGMLLDNFGEHSYEYNIRLEKILLENKTEIIIHASRTNVRVISEYINSENMRLIMNNQVMNVEEICSRLTVNLSKFLGNQEINTIKIGLREMIINGIEHGNLKISFEDKSKLTMSDQYVAHIMEMQKKPEFEDKSITIEYTLKPDSVKYRITDDGDGFNYTEIIDQVKAKNETEMLAHGRGIIMTLNIFDTVLFNEKGNSVTLIKKFNKAS